MIGQKERFKVTHDFINNLEYIYIYIVSALMIFAIWLSWRTASYIFYLSQCKRAIRMTGGIVRYVGFFYT